MSDIPPPPTMDDLPPPPTLVDDLPPPPTMMEDLPPPPTLANNLPPPPPLPKNLLPGKPSFEGSHAKPRKLKGLELSLLHTCNSCKQQINETFFVVCGDYYHINCLKCAKCQKQLKPPNCVCYKNKLLCLNCGEIKDDTKKCMICGQYLFDFDKQIQPPGFSNPLHDSCFSCYECSEHLTIGSFRLLEGYAFCQNCASKYEKRKCAECNQIIMDRFVQAGGRFYHIDHFKCVKCGEILKGKNYIAHHDKYYCPLHGSDFLKRCNYCKKEFSLVNDDSIHWHKKRFHRNCFVCRVCGTKCDPENCKSYHERPHCEECYKKRNNDEGHIDKKHIPEESQKRRNDFKKHFDKKEFVTPVYSKDVPETNNVGNKD